MRIALISDTHVPTAISQLPSRLIERLHTVDLVLHAGDFVSLRVLQSLQAIANTAAVHGNMDEPDVVRRLPRKQLLTLAGRSVGLIHGDRPAEVERQYLKAGHDYDSPLLSMFYEYLLGEFPGADIVVFGHVHVPVVRYVRGRLLVNPGSVAPCGDHSSFGMLELQPSKTEAEIIDL